MTLTQDPVPQPLPMALVVANGGPGWGVLTTTGTTGDAPLPTCLARIVQEKNQVPPCPPVRLRAAHLQGCDGDSARPTGVSEAKGRRVDAVHVA